MKIKNHLRSGLVLTACMHSDFSIVNTIVKSPEVIETYNKHDFLSYGADCQRNRLDPEGKIDGSVVDTCSFYDRLLGRYSCLRSWF